MAFLKSGEDLRLHFESGAGLNAQDLSGYKIAGVDLSAATVTSGYAYSGETYTPAGYKKGGSQIVMCKVGCRPGRRQLLYSYAASGYANSTFTLNSSADGTVTINGQRISKPFSDFGTSENLPCGLQYFVVALVSGGGGGGAAGLLVSYDNNGGSGGAAVFLAKIALGSSYSITVGGKGEGKGGIGADGVNGGASSAFGVSITGGGGADGGGNHAPRQTATVSGSPAGGAMLQGGNGSDTTASSALTVNYPAPEGGTAVSPERFGGAPGCGSGYGAGGDGNPGAIVIWY